MNLMEYSAAVKEIIKGEPTRATLSFVKQLPLGITSNSFGFLLNGKIIKILSSLRSFTSVYNAANRLMPQKDYTLSLRVSSEGKTKTISKSFAADIGVEEAKKNLLEGQKAERVFYEILTTDDFEITYSEYEGTVLKTQDENMARRYLHTFIGLFPFIELDKETKQVKIDCEFDIQKNELYGKEEKKRGKLSCSIYLDGEAIGTKSNSFVF